MTLLRDLEEFVANHRPDGELMASEGKKLTPNAYRLTVSCRCGVTFERWITPQDAAVDLSLMARWN
jgi:hypothetical protein